MMTCKQQQGEALFKVTKRGPLLDWEPTAAAFDLSDGEHMLHRMAASTPAATWRINGEPDPHGSTYDCERAQLAYGSMTDDELANAVYMHDHKTFDAQAVLNGQPSSIGLLTAAKERIRWLSRALVKATAAPAPSALSTHAGGNEGAAPTIDEPATHQHKFTGELRAFDSLDDPSEYWVPVEEAPQGEDEGRRLLRDQMRRTMEAQDECARLRAELEALRASALPAALTDALAKIGAILGPGDNSLSTLVPCIRNIKHFADCLDAVEHEFFMVPGEPNDELPDEKPDDECLLNRWGSTVEQYVEQFRVAIPHLLAASPGDHAEGSRVIRDILAERKHQNREWGGPEHDDSHHAEDWFGLIFAQPEKYWKALERYEKYRAPEDEDEAEQFDRPTEVRRRLVKIAALAVAGMESIDRAAMSASKGARDE